MTTLRVRTALAVLVTALVLSVPSLQAVLPDYKLGDVAVEDVITPVPLLVVNPEATEVLKQKVAQQVQFIVRQTPQSAGEAEKELREKIVTARTSFLVALQRALEGRAPSEADVGSAVFDGVIRDIARESPKDLPFDKLAPMWVRGVSDEAFVDTLLKPLREAMVQPIFGGKADSPLPPNQPVRLIPVKDANEPPTLQQLETTGVTVPSAKVISLWRARRLVETYFPPGQDALGRFAAAFVRGNAFPDPASTELVRAKRMEGVTVNDTYDAAQVVVRKGQSIDRKALSALAVLREKSLIGTLQTKLDTEKSVVGQISGQISNQTKWIVAGLAVMALTLGLILWRLRARPSTTLIAALENPALGAAEVRALPAGARDDGWRDRAMLAEGKAERAHQAIRSGVMGWMREKIVTKLFHQRAELLSAHQKAEAEMHELEQRLEQLHTPLQERLTAYEKRIEELEKDLATKGEENRELIGARISVAKQQLNVERERSRFGTN